MKVPFFPPSVKTQRMHYSPNLLSNSQIVQPIRMAGSRQWRHLDNESMERTASNRNNTLYAIEERVHKNTICFSRGRQPPPYHYTIVIVSLSNKIGCIFVRNSGIIKHEKAAFAIIERENRLCYPLGYLFMRCPSRRDYSCQGTFHRCGHLQESSLLETDPGCCRKLG